MATDLTAASPDGLPGPDAPVVPFGVPGEPGAPTLRWAARATSVAAIDRELARIWAAPPASAGQTGTPAAAGSAAPAAAASAATVTGLAGAPVGDDAAERHVAARTSVLNLVVVAGNGELGERAASILAMGTGRHPSRTLILVRSDPDGPAWIKADVKAWCMTPRTDAPETCSEQVYIVAGGDAGHHLQAIVAPLLVHDLPVTVWWPGDPPFDDAQARALASDADRLVVDGSRWSGDGLARLRALVALTGPSLPVSDFALMRQARWREAIAAVFDRPEFLPYLRSLRRIAVTYATRGGTGAEAGTNLVKPLYHVAWLASRLELRVVRPLARTGRPIPAANHGRPSRAKPPAPAIADPGRGLRAVLKWDRGADVEVVVRPVISDMPGGTTLRVELLAERRGSELRAEVTAEAESVHLRTWCDGVESLDRRFNAPRSTDAYLLTQAIEASGRDHVAEATLAMAAELVGHDPAAES